jgi:hypothetical protein
MEHFGIFYGHLEYSKAIYYIFWSFGNRVVIRYFFFFLVYCIKKNHLATLTYIRKYLHTFFVENTSFKCPVPCGNSDLCNLFVQSF